MKHHTIFRVAVPKMVLDNPDYDIHYFTANGLIEWVATTYNEQCHELWAAEEYLIEDQDCLVANLFLGMRSDQEITNDE